MFRNFRSTSDEIEKIDDKAEDYFQLIDDKAGSEDGNREIFKRIGAMFFKHERQCAFRYRSMILLLAILLMLTFSESKHFASLIKLLGV